MAAIRINQNGRLGMTLKARHVTHTTRGGERERGERRGRERGEREERARKKRKRERVVMGNLHTIKESIKLNIIIYFLPIFLVELALAFAFRTI